MATKYYRVKKDNFMWLEGAVLHDNISSDGYKPIDDLWDKVPLGGEYISRRIIEHPENSDNFERVYPDTLKGNIYRTKDQMVKLYKETFKD